MYVFNDFYNYKSGVYHNSTTTSMNHIVKILGWGTESGMDYWLCANSWGTSWGINGFFKIKQGDCNIDNYVLAPYPKVGLHDISDL
jgi:C1A family cysteine protease